MRIFDESMYHVPFHALTLFKRNYEHVLTLPKNERCEPGDVLRLHELQEHIRLQPSHKGLHAPYRSEERTGNVYVTIITSCEQEPVFAVKTGSDATYMHVTCEPAPAIFNTFLACDNVTRGRIVQASRDAFMYHPILKDFTENERIWLKHYIDTYIRKE